MIEQRKLSSLEESWNPFGESRVQKELKRGSKIILYIRNYIRNLFLKMFKLKFFNYGLLSASWTEAAFRANYACRSLKSSRETKWEGRIVALFQLLLLVTLFQFLPFTIFQLLSSSCSLPVTVFQLQSSCSLFSSPVLPAIIESSPCRCLLEFQWF